MAIRSQIPDLEIETSASLDDAYVLFGSSDEFAVVFDLDGLPKFTPSEAKLFVNRFECATVLVVGRLEQENLATAYLEAGAADFRIADSESLSQFCETINRAIRGETNYGPERTREIFARLQQLSKEVSRINSMEDLVLTNREMEILQYVDEGKSNKQIACSLHISLHTVKNHIHRILEKLHVCNRREAVRLAYTSGWLKMNLP
ncbi:MAG: response regulator transcription factor [Pirellula sp.]